MSVQPRGVYRFPDRGQVFPLFAFGDNTMSIEKSRPRPRRSSLESEEERAWVGFYQRVGRDQPGRGDVARVSGRCVGDGRALGL